jgi:hypothetical protein
LFADRKQLQPENVLTSKQHSNWTQKITLGIVSGTGVLSPHPLSYTNDKVLPMPNIGGAPSHVILSEGKCETDSLQG